MQRAWWTNRGAKAIVLVLAFTAAAAWAANSSDSSRVMHGWVSLVLKFPQGLLFIPLAGIVQGLVEGGVSGSTIETWAVTIGWAAYAAVALGVVFARTKPVVIGLSVLFLVLLSMSLLGIWVAGALSNLR